MKYIYISLLFSTIISCKNGNSSQESSSNYNDEIGEEGMYNDGTYCAEVSYYYSETGTNSTYTLEVEIENNDLTIIHWPNGGWLDSSHFTPINISNGEAIFTSDKGAEYTVRIIGSSGDCITDNYIDNDTEEENQ